VPVIKNFLSEGFTALVMSWFAGLNEIIKTYIQGTPNFFELVCHFVAIGVGIQIKFGSSASDFDGVFVITHEKENIFALHPLEASLDIGTNFFEGCANVGPAVGVIDCGGDKEVLTRRHKEPL
jgi:hypothetical protein